MGLFQRLRRSWSNEKQFTRRTQGDRHRYTFERLEPRMMLNGDPVEFTWADTSLEAEVGVVEHPGLTSPVRDPLPMTTDEGDYYRHLTEQIDLLRASDTFVIAILSEVDIQAVVAELTGDGDALDDYELYATLTERIPCV